MTSKTDGTTHADGCYRWGPRHYDCAAREIERLERELAEAREYIDSLPGNWRTDSSLATWFPITSEAFERTKMELAETRESARAQAQHWRDDALESAAQICERYDIGATSTGPAVDIRAMKSTQPVARASAEPSGWMPIESAPKDGSWFLAHRAHSVLPLIVRWDTAYDAAEDAFGDHVYHLTHWMPLPPPPADQPEGER